MATQIEVQLLLLAMMFVGVAVGAFLPMAYRFITRYGKIRVTAIWPSGACKDRRLKPIDDDLLVWKIKGDGPDADIHMDSNRTYLDGSTKRIFVEAGDSGTWQPLKVEQGIMQRIDGRRLNAYRHQSAIRKIDDSNSDNRLETMMKYGLVALGVLMLFILGLFGFIYWLFQKGGVGT